MTNLKPYAFGLTETDSDKIDIIKEAEGLNSRSQVIRFLLDRRYQEVVKDVKQRNPILYHTEKELKETRLTVGKEFH